MVGTTHLAAGLALAVVMPELSAVGVAGVALGSLLPDIDKPTSLLGRHFPIVPKWLSKIIHRKVTHRLIFFALVYGLYAPLGLGYATHLFLDACTPAGIPFLHTTIRVPFISSFARSGGVFDHILGICLWAFVFWSVAQKVGLLL